MFYVSFAVKFFALEQIMDYICSGIEIWCNGSTTDFGSVCPSSNLGISTKIV